jgi:nitrogen-specific signal transduction histidine kinase
VRVLIADDNSDLAQSLANLLQNRGADTVVVGDGASALREAEGGEFDASVIDLKMPQRSGADVLQALQERGQGGRLVAVTGYEREDQLSAVARLDQVPVLQKPFDPAELLDLLGLLAPSSVLPERSRIAVLLDRRSDLGALRGVRGLDRFEDEDTLREAVAEHPYDAALILARKIDRDELSADLHTLDQDLAVVFTARPELLAEAVERTRERRHRAERATLLDVVFQRTPAPLLVVAGDPPRLALWNRGLRERLGHREEELEGASLDLLEAPGGGQSLAALVEAARLDGHSVRRTLTLRRRGGGLQEFSVLATPADCFDQAVTLHLGTAGPDDPQAEALRMLGATAAGVAHEMRNTLAGVGSSLEVLQHRIPEGSAAASVLARIRERTARASEVMTDLLAFARPLNLRFKTIPARMVLMSAADRIRERAPSGISVDVRIPDPSLRIRVDPVALQMALVDLGNNAVTAMGGQGTVALSCGRLAEDVQIRVADSGPGVPEAIARQIFDPFFTTRTQGSGLGLANVRKVIEAHGGSVDLEDAGPGAHFLIRLPPRPEPPQEQP